MSCSEAEVLHVGRRKEQNLEFIYDFFCEGMMDMFFELLSQVTSNQVPRPEYPRPQMVREAWMNLNGRWQFEVDHGCTGGSREFYKRSSLGDTIVVPFCPESQLSGVANTDFMASVWYRRTFFIPEAWQGQRVLLHFGAVDYHAHVYVNGCKAGEHTGGYSSFSMEITQLLQPGENVLMVWAVDDLRSGKQPYGKQCADYFSSGCSYTRTTGIWQTVWLEAVPQTFIQNIKLTPDLLGCTVDLQVGLSSLLPGYTLTAEASFAGKDMGNASFAATGDRVQGRLALTECHPWEPGKGGLYDMTLKLVNPAGDIIDTVYTYAGLRSVTWGNGAMQINGKNVFQRLILDQGFYPDGIYTAPTDDDLKADISRSMAMGFNGARLHQKIFEPRFLYWADKLGYLVWGEHANWGCDITTLEGLASFLPEWMEAVERDYSHPSIVGWCPFNETWDANTLRGGHLAQDDRVLANVYRVTKAMDSTRPVIDTSGNYHVVTDVFDIHDYDQNPETFKARLDHMQASGEPYITFADRQADAWKGQPYFVSEYGGIKWAPGYEDTGWGYGDGPQSEEEFLARYKGLTEAMLFNPSVCAFCYTQLTDVEQEVNGLYTYDRKPKFDPALIAAINSQKAAIEE